MGGLHPHTPSPNPYARGYGIGSPLLSSEEAFSLYGMDFEALAELFLESPWLVSAGLAILAGTLMVLLFRLAGSRRRKAWALLRPPKDQARFEPLSTVYDPRPYRRRRETKK